MLYKVYLNLCDFGVGSYLTLGTKAAQSYYISTCHLDDPCQIFLHLVYEFIRRFFLKIPLFIPFLELGPFITPGTLFAQLESPYPNVTLHTKYQCIRAIGLWEKYF